MFGNLLGQESRSANSTLSYSGSFNTSDTGNVSISSPRSSDNTGNTTLNIGQPTQIQQWAPWLALGAVALVFALAFRD